MHTFTRSVRVFRWFSPMHSKIPNQLSAGAATTRTTTLTAGLSATWDAQATLLTPVEETLPCRCVTAGIRLFACSIIESLDEDWRGCPPFALSVVFCQGFTFKWSE